MKQKVLASIICSLFISGNVQAHTQGFETGKDNIALGDTAVAVGNGNISIGTGAVAVGNGMNKAQIEAAIKQQQALVNEISLLKNSIKSNEAKNQSYLDTVDKIERNKQIIADLQSKLDSSKLENINLSQEYQDTKTRYDFQKAIIDDKKKIISQLDFSKITANWETDGGLDALAQRRQ